MLFSTIRPELEVERASLTKFSALFGLVLRLSDLVLVVAMGAAAYWLRFGGLKLPPEFQQAIARAVLFALLVFGSSSVYRSWRGISVVNELTKLLAVWSVIFGLGVLYVALLKVNGVTSRLWWGYWFVGTALASCGVRLLCRHAAAWVRERGLDARSAVVVGATSDATRIVATLARQRWAGIDVQGWFGEAADEGALPSVPRLGGVAGLAAYVEANQIAQVWIALPVSEQRQIDSILSSLRHSTADIKFVPDLFGIQLLNHSVEQVAGLPVINLQQTPLHGYARVLKGFEDRVLALLILLAIAPVMLVIAVAVKLSSPGPVLYRQERMSWNNKTFGMLKFRSMPVEAEKHTGAVWARAGESRATAVGRLLRRTSLDELPQFLNVLKGDMSIVGPRPERPVFVDKFKDEIPSYMKKHMVKAGITGWAQVNGWRGSTDLSRRIECDIYYIENWSLALDLKIIFLTLFKGFVSKNAY